MKSFRKGVSTLLVEVWQRGWPSCGPNVNTPISWSKGCGGGGGGGRGRGGGRGGGVRTLNVFIQYSSSKSVFFIVEYVPDMSNRFPYMCVYTFVSLESFCSLIPITLSVYGVFHAVIDSYASVDCTTLFVVVQFFVWMFVMCDIHFVLCAPVVAYFWGQGPALLKVCLIILQKWHALSPMCCPPGIVPSYFKYGNLHRGIETGTSLIVKPFLVLCHRFCHRCT